MNAIGKWNDKAGLTAECQQFALRTCPVFPKVSACEKGYNNAAEQFYEEFLRIVDSGSDMCKGMTWRKGAKCRNHHQYEKQPEQGR